MTGDSPAPTYADLLIDLRTVRTGGVGKLRQLNLPALSSAAALQEPDATVIEPAMIAALLREAVDMLGGGTLQEAAEYLLGLYPGTALYPANLRREKSAEVYGLNKETFRKQPQRDLLGQIAEAILSICHDARLRRTRLDMEQHRHPADSRLAVQWVERFEAYYRIWTPAYALAADLEAAIDTFREPETEHPPWAPDSDEPYDRDEQARGYGRSALYWLAAFHLEVKRFVSKHGGLWLLSDPQIEQDVADAVYRIGWHNPLADHDESFLRRHLADARHEEPAQFWNIIQAFPEAQSIHDRWQQMILDGVECITDEDKRGSQVWLTIKACHDYCESIDADWLRIADWYRPGSSPRSRPVTGQKLYGDLLDKKRS